MIQKKHYKYRDILLSAGHTNVKGLDMGAVANGYIEGELTVEFRDLVKVHLECMGHKVTIENNAHALSKTVRVFKNITNHRAILVDFHWNAATPGATGTESFVPENPSKIELCLASNMSETCSRVLGIPTRGVYKGYEGVKPESLTRHKRLGWMRLTGHNVLLEVCFLTNQGDMNAYEENKNILAHSVALDIHLASVIKTDIDDYEKPNGVHTVVSGDTLSGIGVRYDRSVLELMEMNDMMDTTIYIGQDLYV